MRLQDTTRRKDSLIPGLSYEACGRRIKRLSQGRSWRAGVLWPGPCLSRIIAAASQSSGKYTIAMCDRWDWSASFSGFYHLRALRPGSELVLL